MLPTPLQHVVVHDDEVVQQHPADDHQYQSDVDAPDDSVHRVRVDRGRLVIVALGKREIGVLVALAARLDDVVRVSR